MRFVFHAAINNNTGMDKKSNYGNESGTRIVAVIDIGATSVRMMIAEIKEDGETCELESLAQSVQLGRDTFKTGEISRASTEDCVRVLTVYQEKLREYGIERREDVRVVATSAVREANNRLAFQDRIYVATGLAIEPFDEASLHRTTFIGIRPILEENPHLNQGQTLVCEVGGGTTEFLVMEDGQVTFANTYRLGALRLIKSMEGLNTPLSQNHDLMASQIDQTTNQILSVLSGNKERKLIVMGGEMRLAALHVNATKKSKGQAADNPLVRLSVEKMEEFSNAITEQTPDVLTKKYQLSPNEAQTLAPALLINLHLAKALGVQELHVAEVNLREGLINDLMMGKQWMGQADSQVLDSAIELGRRFNFDEAHARHVDYLANQIFEETQTLHRLSHRWQLLLRMAATLHEVGKAIGTRSYHKHSMYIIRHSSVFGLSSADLSLVALIARYHRRAIPQMRHDAYSQLGRENRVNISKMAAILRVAKSLDASRSQRIKEIECHIGGGLSIFVPGIADLSLEQLELKGQRVLFENIFGVRPSLTKVPLDNEASGLLPNRRR